MLVANGFSYYCDEVDIGGVEVSAESIPSYSGFQYEVECIVVAILFDE